MTIYATYYGSNGWLIEIDGLRVLIDPWLVGELIFPPGKWFFSAQHRNEWQIPDGIDLIVLTQGLADHLHVQTLEKLPKKTPVLCSSSCIKKLDKLKYKNITAISPGEKVSHEHLEIIATSGAPVPNIENGYILRTQGTSIYLEPHGYLDPEIEDTRMNIVITPIVNVSIPMFGKLICGKEILPELIQRFSPDHILATANGGDIIFNGMLNKLLNIDDNLTQINPYILNKTNIIKTKPGLKYIL